MKHIIAFAGSNSKTSINQQLVSYASSLVEDVNVTILDLNDFEMPLYGIDLEKEQGIPEKAKTFLKHIETTDGIILSLAEHNGAYTVAFKNVFDWMSRLESKTFFGKPMLLMATSPGARGGQSVLGVAAERFPFHDANIIGTYSLPSFSNNFDNGKITNEELNQQLLTHIKTFQEAL
ncbi:NADPH-dependent FMN reductase [Psychroserpens sp. XS_ASV72]|uniref:NADPH-dependent FMN reductase n=1 Tax=Psychroserpens sp. XS_ASV72 TaxID=3241293 RepID=UPI0035139F3E